MGDCSGVGDVSGMAMGTKSLRRGAEGGTAATSMGADDGSRMEPPVAGCVDGFSFVIRGWGDGGCSYRAGAEWVLSAVWFSEVSERIGRMVAGTCSRRGAQSGTAFDGLAPQPAAESQTVAAKAASRTVLSLDMSRP